MRQKEDPHPYKGPSETSLIGSLTLPQKDGTTGPSGTVRVLPSGQEMEGPELEGKGW